MNCLGCQKRSKLRFDVNEANNLRSKYSTCALITMLRTTVGTRYGYTILEFTYNTVLYDNTRIHIKNL